MGRNISEIELVVARTLRDSLEKLQRTSEDVNQAVGDLVSACASARPSNSLPHILRAQTSAASLAASLDVLSRFITSALHQDWRAPFAPPALTPEVEKSAPADPAEPVAPTAVEETLRTVASETEAFDLDADAIPDAALSVGPLEQSRGLQVFDVSMLPSEEQELHRRANRVAKVSMQDIKMLRPADVQLGKENNDICSRLRDDIERAHKEYDRRFHAILDHPVDYFYAWMVDILGEGDPQALGEYPYPSTVLRR